MATPMSLEQQVASWFLESNVTLATAESCTGGLIAHRLTNVSGASGFYAGGVVAYSNKIKETLLGVPAAVLTDHGAVSPETARAMAEGARRLMGTDYGLAVTGIAGPNGGSADKPVGLVYIAVARAGGDTQAWSRQFSGVRGAIKAQTAETALEMLLELFV